MIDEFNLLKLTTDTVVKPFKCSDDDLNGFLIEDAVAFHKEKLATTYILESDDSIVAYFSLLNDKISVIDLRDKDLIKNFKSIFPRKKRFRYYPAVKLGRLAVSEEFANKGVGGEILDFLKVMFTTNNRTGCRFLTVDAYSAALPFYVKNDFKFFTEDDKENHTRLMYYDLQDFS